MQKPQDSDQEIVFDFIDMALRHLEGGRENPRFKPLVLWALQNIPALRRTIGPPDHSPNFFHFLSEKAKKEIEGVATEEERKAKLDKILNENKRNTKKLVKEFIAENNWPTRDLEKKRRSLKREEVYIPREIKGEVGLTIFHIQTNGNFLEQTKTAKFWAVHDADFEKMLDDAPTTPEEPHGRTV